MIECWRACLCYADHLVDLLCLLFWASIVPSPIYLRYSICLSLSSYPHLLFPFERGKGSISFLLLFLQLLWHVAVHLSGHVFAHLPVWT